MIEIKCYFNRFITIKYYKNKKNIPPKENPSKINGGADFKRTEKQ